MSELHVKLGELLELERGRQRVSLEDVSAELKIAEETLVQIEKGDIDSLPAPLYFKLFAKSYAEFLGIDYSKTVEAIREELGEDLDVDAPSQSLPTIPPKKAAKIEKDKKQAKGETDLSGFIKKAGILAGIIIGSFLIILIVYQMFFASDAKPGTEDEPMTLEESSGPASTGETTESSLLDNYNWNVPEYAPPDSIRLSLVARESSWAAVFADGDTAIYRNLVAGRTYEIAAKYRLTVSVGVPRLVSIQLDGTPAYLADPETGRISRVRIDQTNRQLFKTKPGESQPVTPAVGQNRVGESETVVTNSGQGEG